MAIALPVGCAGEVPAGRGAESRGSVALELSSGDIALQSAHYIVSNGSTTVTGDIEVASPSALASLIGGIPSGTQYVLSLAATGAGGTGIRCTGSSRFFDVEPGVSTSVSLQLECREVGPGGVSVRATINECPTITSVSADPPRCANGVSSIAIHVAATDGDHGPRPLSFVWSNGLAGSDPVFTCAQIGPSSFTVTVSDGDTSPGCDHTFGLTVLCDACPMP